MASCACVDEWDDLDPENFGPPLAPVAIHVLTFLVGQGTWCSRAAIDDHVQVHSTALNRAFEDLGDAGLIYTRMEAGLDYRFVIGARVNMASLLTYLEVLWPRQAGEAQVAWNCHQDKSCHDAQRFHRRQFTPQRHSHGDESKSLSRRAAQVHRRSR